MVDFYVNFQLFLLPGFASHEADPDLGGRNETDPSGSGSTTLVATAWLLLKSPGGID